MLSSAVVWTAIQAITPWLEYLLMTAAFALYYKLYAEGGANKLLVRVVKLVLMLISVCVFASCAYAVYTMLVTIVMIAAKVDPLTPILSTAAILLILLAATLARYPWEKLVCVKEEEREVDGVRYVVCYSDAVNAWYDHRVKKIYVSSMLAEHLSSDEIKAIVYHEEGHARNKLLNYVRCLLITAWMFTLSCITFVLLVLWKVPSAPPIFLIEISTVYALAALITLSAMVPSWIAEHESDRRALETTDLETVLRALIKTHTYALLMRECLLRVVTKCEIKHLHELVNLRQEVSFTSLFKSLLQYSLVEVPKSIFECLRNPIYRTHPPLRLRLALLLHHARRA